MVNKLDLALWRAVFLGWPESISAEKRLELMDKFMKEKFSTYRVVDFGHEYIGPYNNRKLSPASWVEFSNNDITKAFVKKIETGHFELRAEGANVKIKLSVPSYRKNAIILFTKQLNY